jgi:hypothetical protein
MIRDAAACMPGKLIMDPPGWKPPWEARPPPGWASAQDPVTNQDCLRSATQVSG